LGNVGYHFVRKGNVLLARVILLLLVASVKGCLWLLGQPDGTCAADQDRFTWFTTIVEAHPYKLAILSMDVLSFLGPPLLRAAGGTTRAMLFMGLLWI